MSDISGSEASIQQEEEITDLSSAIRRVLKNALAVDGVARGLHEAAKVIDSEKAQFVFLSESCDADAYKKLVKALCLEKKVPSWRSRTARSSASGLGSARSTRRAMPRRSSALPASLSSTTVTSLKASTSCRTTSALKRSSNFFLLSSAI